jgi:ELWxxDGT repeat protein
MILRNAFFVIAASMGATAQAGEIPPIGMNLIKDMNTAEEPAGSQPSDFFVVGDKAYFAAYRPESGIELFVTDGTEAGSKPFADLLPGSQPSAPAVIGVAGGHLILRAGEYTNRQIWSVALANGVARQLTTVPRPTGEPEHWTYAFAGTANRLLFRRGDDAGVWSTDGTASGTFPLPVDANFPLNYATNGCSGDQEAILAGSVGGSFDVAIVATDGTSAGSRPLVSFTSMTSSAALRSGGFCYFLMTGAGAARWELWRSDGTVAGTVRIAQDNWYPLGFAAIGDAFYIGERALTQDRSRVVRVSAAEPTPAPIAEFTGSDNYSYELRTVDNTLLFFQRSAAESDSLYLSDGTAAGTRKVFPAQPGQFFRTRDLFALPGAVIINEWTDRLRLDLNTGALTPGPRSDDFSLGHQARLGSVLVGRGVSDPFDQELSFTDGTAAGTQALKDLWAPTADGIITGGPSAWALVDDVLVVSGLSEPLQPWSSRTGILRSDGTAQGTYAMARSAYDQNSVSVVARLGSDVAFLSRGLNGESTLYRASPALTGASSLASGTGSWSGLQSFAGASRLLFGCSGLFAEIHLCSYSESAGSLPVGPAGVAFDLFDPIGDAAGVALLPALDDSQLWRSDGTAPGTFALGSWKAVWQTPSAPLGGKLYLHACLQGVCGLVASDGTLAGTSKLLDTASDSEIRSMAVLSGRVLFLRSRGDRSELWGTDGTVGGTQSLAVVGAAGAYGIATLGGRAHVAARPCDGCGSSYVISDGTVAGTRHVDLPAGVSTSTLFLARLDDDTAVFDCTTAERGTELCAVDATGDHFALLPEIFPGIASPHYLQPLVANSQGLFFTADDRAHGRELWFLRKLPDSIFANGFEAASGRAR